MLYDTEWQKYNYAGVYLPSFVAWLSTKPRDEWYPFMLPGNCAVGQYLRDIGYSEDDLRVSFVGGGEWLADIVADGPWTFGALHDRARALMDSAND